ncbi:MAG TPA: CPBP family intramembrane glutamic endopeptidase [Kofleriaceae bacterium]|nr:CPBP family intramembrane glutamic endopeptidase [Kofleriaceae bacterium]
MSGGATAATRLAIALGLAAAWPLVFALDVRSAVPWLAVLAAAIIAVAVAVERPRLAALLRPTLDDLRLGALTGAVMVGVTYGGYHLAAHVVPGLRADVAEVVALAGPYQRARAVPLLLLVVVAEELLWRGVLLGALAERQPIERAAALSLLTYAAAQAGAGSVLIVAVALACGGVWTWLRVRTGRLPASLVSHAMWTTTVVVIHPLA